MREKQNLETLELLAATIAHEVKSPLSLIKANVDYMQLCDVDHAYSKNFDVIRRELQKTGDMLNGFIELIQLSYGYNEDVAIYDVIMNVVNTYEKNGVNGVSFNVSCPDKNLAVIGNLRLFTIALSNIVKNAVEAFSLEDIQKNRAKISVTAGMAGHNVEISVSDNGPGLSKEALESIASKDSFTTKAGGSGVGLSVCRSVAVNHGGSFEIKNGENGGCIAILSVPAN